MTVLIDAEKVFDEMNYDLYIDLGTALNQGWLSLVVVTQHSVWGRDIQGGGSMERPARPVSTCGQLLYTPGGRQHHPKFPCLTAGAVLGCS